MLPVSSMSQDSISSPRWPLNTSATELLTPAHCSSADFQNQVGHIFPGGGMWQWQLWRELVNPESVW